MQNAVFNRGKNRITLDLKQSSDLETAKDLIQSADVLIENFRPGVMDRLGLGADAMTALNPRLIYLSLPGFASTDKEKSQIRAFEGVISASVGVFTDLAARNTKPIYTPIPMGSSYGAEVIKIDTMDPLFGPQIFCWFPMEASPGKRHLLLNLKENDGLKVFKDLVHSADVIVHNFRTGVADRMGIGYDEVSKDKPDIVYSNMTALGGPKPGPWMHYPGFDPMVQGSVGIQMRYAGEGNRPILHGWASCIDYITGYSGTLGAALALFRLKRSGASNGGAYVQTSLAQGGQLVQAPFMYSSEKASSGDEPQGQDAVGEHSLHRIYQASDGSLFLAGKKSEVGLLSAVPGLTGVPVVGEEDESERVSFLEGKISEQPVKHWVEAFLAAGLGCHRVDCLDDVRDTYLHEVTSDLKGDWDDGRSISVVRMPDHPSGSAVDLGPPAYAKFKHAKLKLCTPNPRLGQHTREILSELGYSQEKIDDLVKREVVKESFTEHYLPH